MNNAPIFLLSLPRSGSTLLQRMLATHPEISTASEPWILLPLMHMLKSEGVYAVYDHEVASTAIRDFAQQLPGGSKDLYEEIRRFVGGLYSRLGTTTRYFLDKTPRYSLVAMDIVNVFPDAKYVILFRNPLAVMASMMLRWSHLNRFRQDLYFGLRSLVSAKDYMGSACITVRFEDLLLDPEDQLQQICGYLKIEYIPAMKKEFGQVELSGRFGDSSNSSVVKLDPLDKWQSTLRANPFRHYLARRYLRWIGEKDLASMGYNYAELAQELGKPPISLRYILSDVVNFTRGVGAGLLEPQILFDKFRNFSGWGLLFPHR